MLQTLQELCVLRGVAGGEEAVREYIYNKALPFVDEIKIDPLGSVLVYKKGAERRKHPLMLCAHMDECGFKVQKINENGILAIAPVGETTPVCWPGSRVKIGADGLAGVLAAEQSPGNRSDRSALPPGKILLDIGVSDKKGAENLVEVGDAVTFDSDWMKLGKRKIKSRALESRIGCVVLLALLSEPLAYDTWFVFTACDSIKSRGSVGRGSSVAAAAIKPQTILFVECRPAYDFDSVEPAERNLTLGKGCAVLYAERGSTYTRSLRNRMTEKAKEQAVCWQYPTTLGRTLPSSRTAVPAAGGAESLCLAAPLRYMNTANAVADLDDIEALKALSRLFVMETEKTCD